MTHDCSRSTTRFTKSIKKGKLGGLLVYIFLSTLAGGKKFTPFHIVSFCSVERLSVHRLLIVLVVNLWLIKGFSGKRIDGTRWRTNFSSFTDLLNCFPKLSFLCKRDPKFPTYPQKVQFPHPSYDPTPPLLSILKRKRERGQLTLVKRHFILKVKSLWL